MIDQPPLTAHSEADGGGTPIGSLQEFRARLAMAKASLRIHNPALVAVLDVSVDDAELNGVWQSQNSSR